MAPPAARPAHNPDRHADMKKLLVPVDGSECSLRAVRHLIGKGSGAALPGTVEIHLVNVQPGLPGDITRFVSREQVAGYQMAGEIIGLDGIATGCHTCNAAALEDSEVCAVPFDRLEQMAQANPVIRNSVRQLLAAEVRRNHGHMLLLGSMRAEERVASFLLNLAERYRRRGYSGSEFVLRMTREEIGSYLGLKLETVSRVFSRMQADGLIQAQGRDVKLLDPPQLNHLVGRDGPPSDL
jgi:CRP/FNR family transcriptional regulator